jgi:ABC-type Fe3+-hydroxamate transport system substrate-binding protein
MAAGAPSDGYSDAAGRVHHACEGEPRIVSLVPSITELICALGLTKHLVGRTGFCIHPKAELRDVPKVGGTKDVDLDKIRELDPTHVVVNIDENTKKTAEALAAFVPHLVVTHPLRPLDNPPLYRLLGAIFRRENAAEQLAASFGAVYDNAVKKSEGCKRYAVLYLIWKKPWMTVSRDTYISRTLAVFGLDTVPANSTIRYPEIELETAARDADIVLLSTEPYRFGDEDVADLRAVPGMENTLVELVDGEMTSWYGPRAIAGMDYLLALRQRLEAQLPRI